VPVYDPQQIVMVNLKCMLPYRGRNQNFPGGGCEAHEYKNSNLFFADKFPLYFSGVKRIPSRTRSLRKTINFQLAKRNRQPFLRCFRIYREGRGVPKAKCANFSCITFKCVNFTLIKSSFKMRTEGARVRSAHWLFTRMIHDAEHGLNQTLIRMAKNRF